LLKISNLQASNVADAINVTLPRALDGALNAIIPFLDVEAIVAEIVSPSQYHYILKPHEMCIKKII